MNAVKKIDVVWMGSGWHFLIPLFQKSLDKTLPKHFQATVRAAARKGDGSLELSSLKGADVLIPTMEPCREAELLAANSTLKLVYQPATGIDNIAVDKCKALGIPICNAPGQNYMDTAEGTVMLMLAISRRLPEALQNVAKRQLGGPTGCSLFGKTLGIIGYGRIGKEVNRICREAFKMNSVSIGRESTRAEFENLLKCSDYVSLHCPLNEQTLNMLGDEEFKIMKEGVFIINTARGKLISKESIKKALLSGKVAGFACDTFWEEPADPEDELLALPNVIITPHVCSSTFDFFGRIANLCATNILAVVNGQLDELAYRL